MAMLGLLNTHSHRDAEYGTPAKKALNDKSRRSDRGHRNDRHHVTQIADCKVLARVDRAVSQAEGGRVIWKAVSFPARCLSDRCFECGATVRVMYRQANVLFVDALTHEA